MSFIKGRVETDREVVARIISTGDWSKHKNVKWVSWKELRAKLSQDQKGGGE